MNVSDLFRTEAQKIKARVPAAMLKLEHLLEIADAEAALKSLAFKAATVRGGQIRGSLQDNFGRWLRQQARELEWEWWADRACYQALRDGGAIEGGPPSIPGLWDKEMEEFISWYLPSCHKADGEMKVP
jgi:hypothetical protein